MQNSSPPRSQNNLRNPIPQYNTSSQLNQDYHLNLSRSSRIPKTYNQLGSQIIPPSQLRNYDDSQTIIEKLIKSKKIIQDKNQKQKSNQQFRRRLFTLQGTQKKIFNQVITLLDQIQQIKLQIQKQQSQKLKLQVQKQHLIKNKIQNLKNNRIIYQIDTIVNNLSNKLNNNQYLKQDIKLSYIQLEKIISQNQQIQRKINILELQKDNNIQQLLNSQKNRYKQLEYKLWQKQKQLNQMNLDSNQLKNLQSNITKLIQQNHWLEQLGQNSQLDIQIERLKQDNQMLRYRTIQLLTTSDKNDGKNKQRRKLQQYIQRQQENKIIFLQDLRAFKIQFNKLRNQNQQLKRKARQKYAHEEQIIQKKSLKQNNNLKNRSQQHEIINKTKNIIK